MLLGKHTPTRYEISITPVAPARRPLWLNALLILLLSAVAVLVSHSDEDNATPNRPPHTQTADDRPHGQD